MTEPTLPEIPAARPLITPKRGRDAFSLVWIVPLIALMIAVGLVYRHFESLGPLITISFATAEGIEAGRTPIKRLNVQIGLVENIELDESLGRVIVSARMTENAASYLNAQTRFWVVRPRVGLGGISGLNTLLSGSYIEMDSVRGGDSKDRFVGLEEPPLTPEGAPGIRLTLHAEEGGSVSSGSPVYYRQIKVGRVESRRLSDDGKRVELAVFIDAPYHKLINSNTRFWNASGFDLKLTPDGIELRTETLEAILFGGVAFSNPPRLYESNPVEPGASFVLFSDEEQAESQTAEASQDQFGLVLYFNESVRGLRVGAPVEFLGVQVGHVADITIEYNPVARQVEVPVLVFLDFGQITGLTGTVNVDEALPRAIARGVRARLQSSSLLTGQLIVELAVVPDAGPATFTESGPYYVFPTVPSPFSQITTKASGFLTKLNNLPLDELVHSATRLMKDTNALVREPDVDGKDEEAETELERLRNAPLPRLLNALTATLAGIDAIIASDDVKQLPGSLAGSLGELDATLKSVRDLIQGDITVSPLYYEFSTALQELTRAARAVRELTTTLEEKPNSLIFGK